MSKKDRTDTLELGESHPGPQKRTNCPFCGEGFGNLPTHLRGGCDG